MARDEITAVGQLASDRFRLRDEIEIRIQEHRHSERQNTFQSLMFADSALAVSEACALNFKTMRYEPSYLYEGGFQFEKHYFGSRPGELVELTKSGKLTEEFQCAQFLDELPEVKFWVRNLSKKFTAFRLQTSSDWFYPDFVAQLTDGRVLVFEYKGKDRYDNADSAEKRAIGAVWAARSGGTCLFEMPTQLDFSGVIKAVRSAAR